MSRTLRTAGVAIIAAGLSQMATAGFVDAADGSCAFSPRTGTITLKGERLAVQADENGVIRWRAVVRAPGPWLTCNAEGGTTATLTTVSLIDVKLWGNESGYDELIVELGVIGDELAAESGLASEQIAVTGPEPMLRVVTSDVSSHVVVGPSWIDLDGDGSSNLSISSLWPHGVSVAGGAGADWLDAADSESWLFSSLSGGGDDDVLLGSVGGADGVPFGDHLSGGPGNDLLYGRGGEDRLTGDDGDDWLYGGDHHDVLGGGPGADHLYGGTGPDKCTVDAIDTVSADCETTVELQLKPA